MHVSIRYHYRPSDDREEYRLFATELKPGSVETTEIKVEIDFDGKLTVYESVYEAAQLSVWHKVDNISLRAQAALNAVEADLAKRRADAEFLNGR